MNRRMGWTAALGAGAALAWTLGCGGGGGGGSGGGGSGQITGSLSRSGAVQMARPGRMPTWLARAAAWIGAGNALADGTTTCGNPTQPAEGVTVSLLDSSGAVVQTTTTDANGEFTFTGLAPGDYVVQVTLATGSILSTPATVQEGQTTTLTGELDVDCDDVDSDGNTAEVELKVQQTTPDGSEIEADDTEDDDENDNGDVNDDDDQSSGQTGTQGTGGEDDNGSSSGGSGSSEDGGSSESGD